MTVARSHKGGAKATTIPGGLTNVATSFTVATGGGTGYPDGSAGVFVLTLDAGLPAEEKVLCSARTADTFTITTRGYDDTAASIHPNGVSVRHTYAAIEAQEANDHIVATSAAHAATAISNTPAGGIASTQVQAALNELDTEKLAKSSNLSDLANAATARANLGADTAYANITAETAWIAYTPTLGNVTLGNGTIVGAYKKVGKTLHFRAMLTLGTTTTIGGSGPVTFSLPAATSAIASTVQHVPAGAFNGANIYPAVGVIGQSGTTINFYAVTSNSNNIMVGIDTTHPSTWATGGVIDVTATIEIT